MTKKIFRSILLVASLVLLAAIAVIMGVMYEYFTSLERDKLNSQLSMAIAGVEKDGARYLSSLGETDCRLTWVDSDGKVIFDSEMDAASMENHQSREEIAQAFKTGSGESTRYSNTFSQRTIYLARQLSDGTVLRASATERTVLALFFGMLQPILIVFALSIVISAVLAKRMSKRIVNPLNELDLDRPLENDAYDELSPLLLRIDRQHRRIESQLEDLTRRSNELAAVIGSMNEGMILLNSEGMVLSINPAAMELFETDESALGHDFLTVDRTREVDSAISRALCDGSAQIQIDRHGKIFQLNVSRIGSKGSAAGTALLTFDITERSLLERSRREFTANVSHELKTPLQSIMGSAELMENGLVKPDDMPTFISRIRAEAKRLVALIDDIIRLSRLDEGVELSRERVDLLALAQEVISALAPSAKEKRVSLKLEGEPVEIEGVRRLLYEIIYNLCDNAIRYNVENGSVVISVKRNDADNGKVILSVSDTGIGIPPEHTERVFERFYRVDKSHSRETGGTGLGLSIVKHAAMYHHAEIILKSRVGEGTVISVVFLANCK